jgi:hypothetical protein
MRENQESITAFYNYTTNYMNKQQGRITIQLTPMKHDGRTTRYDETTAISNHNETIVIETQTVNNI